MLNRRRLAALAILVLLSAPVLVPMSGALTDTHWAYNGCSGSVDCVVTFVKSGSVQSAGDGGSTAPQSHPDADQDHYGDDWEAPFAAHAGDLVNQFDGDLDTDQLRNLQEFRWNTIPLPYFPNASDYDQDNWTDGEEVRYWNDINNDQLNLDLSTAKTAVSDRDYSQNYDNDTFTTTHDPDSDNDGLLDGDETKTYHSYPEFFDSDCTSQALACPTPLQVGTTWKAQQDPNQPGTGDGMSDAQELNAWNAMSPGLWSVDIDRDGIASNLLDPDSDGDGILDATEFNCQSTNPTAPTLGACTSANAWDTDHDGLLDGHNTPLTTTDNRTSLYLATHIAHQDQGNGVLLFLGELDEGTDPTQWDTDNDGMPDGWETQGSLQPRVNDANGDSDADGLSNLAEYQYERPTSWNENVDGAWWYNLNPGNPDTDGDGAWDKDEIDHGTNPRDGQDTWNGAYPHDPTGQWDTVGGVNNENLDESLMDPTNLNYLKNNIVDKSADSDGITTAADEAISALISGNVSAALATVYNVSPIAPPVGDVAPLVNASTDAVLALVRCGKDAADATTGNPSDAVAVANNATLCASETLVPFVDTLADRTLSKVHDVSNIVQGLVPIPLPANIDTAQTLDKPASRVTSALNSPLDAPSFVASALNIDALLNDSLAPVDMGPTTASVTVAAAQLVPVTSRHPTFTFDTIHAGGLDAAWPAVQEANRAANEAGVDPIATVDSVFANLVTQRAGVERITRVTPERTCIQLDSSTLTRDASGCDLYASLNISTQTTSAPNSPDRGSRSTPTLRIETAMPGASFDLLALGYVQLANAPTIMVIGYDATSGQPQSWDGSIQEYDATNETNRSMVIASSVTDSRATVRLDIIAGAFLVDTSSPTKPVIEGEETTLEANGPAPAQATFGLTRTFNAISPTDTSTLKLATSLSTGGAWTLAYADDHAAHNAQASLTGPLAAGTTTLQTTAHAVAKSSWSWNAPSVTSALTFDAVEQGGAQPTRALHLDATSLPPIASLSSDTTTHQHAYQTGTAASPEPASTTLNYVLAEGTTSCPSIGWWGAPNFLIDAEPSFLCATGRLDHVVSLATQATRGISISAATTAPAGSWTLVNVHDTHDMTAFVDNTAKSWTLTYDSLPNATRGLGWHSNTPTPYVYADFDWRADTTHHERTITTYGPMPTTMQAWLDVVGETATVDASAPSTTAQMLFTNTGNALLDPFFGLNLVRVHKITDPTSPQNLGYEATFDLADTGHTHASVQPDGTFALDSTLTSPHAFSAHVNKEGYNVAIDTTTLAPGGVSLQLKPGDNAGNLTLAYSAPSTTDRVRVAAVTLEGSLAWTGTSVPSSVVVQGDATRQSLVLDATDRLATFDLAYATSDTSVSIPSNAGQPYFVVRTTVDGGTGSTLAAHLQNVGLFDAKLANENVVLSTNADPNDGLYLAFTTSDAEHSLTLQQTPTTLALSQGSGSFSWTHTGPASVTFSSYSSTSDQVSRQVSGTNVPTRFAATWTSKYAGQYQAVVTHDGTSLDYVSIDENTMPSGAATGGFKLRASDLAPTATLTIQPASGVMHAASANAQGAPEETGHLFASFPGTGSSYIAPPNNYAGDSAMYVDEGDHASGMVDLHDFLALDANLVQATSASAQPTSTLMIQRANPANVLAEGTNVGTEAKLVTIRADNAPPTFALNAQAGAGTGQEGFQVALANSADSGPLVVQVNTGARTLGIHTSGSTPGVAILSWTTTTPFDLTASGPLNLDLYYQDGAANGLMPTDSSDFVVAKTTDGVVSVGARLTGVQTLHLDPTVGTLTSTGDATTVPVLIDLVNANGRINLAASDLPTSLDARWQPAGRDLQLTTPGLDSFALEVRPTSDEADRLHIELTSLPAGTVSLAQDATGGVTFAAPSDVGSVNVAADHGGTSALKMLVESGVRVTRTSSADELAIHLPGLKTLAWAPAQGAAAPKLAIDASGDAGSATIRLEDAQSTLRALLQSFSGSATLEWPRLPAQGDTNAAARFHFEGAAASARLTAEYSNGDHAETYVNGGGAFTSTFDPTGNLDLTTATPASDSTFAALWAGGAVDVRMTNAPTHTTVAADLGLRQATVSANGATIGRIVLALAPTTGPSGGGQLPLVTGATDILSIDTTTTGGLLALALNDVASASWNLPNGTSEADTKPLRVTIHEAGSPSAALVQVVHPDYQLHMTFPQGMPADVDEQITRTATWWENDLTAPGSTSTIQYQDAHSNVFTMRIKDTPSVASLRVTPASSTNTIAYVGGASELAVETRWGGSYAHALLVDGVPNVVLLDSGAPLLQTGGIITSGTIGHADILVVPDASQTINRLNPHTENLAIETTGKAPYESIDATGLQGAQWTLPDARTNSPVTVTLTRAAPVDGDTLLALNAPGDDVTAKIHDSAASFTLKTTPSTRATSGPGQLVQPFSVQFSPNGYTEQIDVTHLHAQTNQLASVTLVGAATSTLATATGAEPPTVTVTSGGMLDRVGIQTTDAGTFLNLQALSISPLFSMTATRGDCSAASRAGVMLIGESGPTLAQIGDGSKVPASLGDYYADYRCQPSDISLGLKFPSVSNDGFTQTPCAGDLTGDLLGNVDGDAPGSSAADVPFTFATPAVLITGTTRTEAIAGTTHISFGCDDGVTSFNYGATSRLKHVTVALQPTAPSNLPSTPLSCPMKMEDRCVQLMTFGGDDLPTSASARFQNISGQHKAIIEGGAGKSLDIGILLEKVNKTKSDTHFAIVANMPVQSVTFRKSDSSNPPRPASNQIIYFDNPTEDTLVVGLDHITSGLFTLDKAQSPFSLKVHMDYQGSTTSGLNVALTNDQCSEQKISMSNVPSGLSLDMNYDAWTDTALIVNTSSVAIQSVDYVNRLWAACDDVGGGKDLFVKAIDIPAGSWKIGSKFGAAGFVGLHPNGQFGQLDLGIAAPGDATRYVSLHLEHGSFGYEWDFDGDSNIDHNPYYVYCDGVKTTWGFRARWSNFGIGVDPPIAHSGVGCDQLQLKWYFEPVLGVPIPHFSRTGRLVLDGTLPSVAVFVAGQWWSTPNRLWS